jgi:hypothetical protein
MLIGGVCELAVGRSVGVHSIIVRIAVVRIKIDFL